MLIPMAAVFASDAIVTFLQIKEREQWLNGHTLLGAAIDGVTAFVIGVSIIFIAEYTWVILPASVAGVLAGRWLAWRF